MGLGEGKDGNSATFITFNLNAPFVYKTGDIEDGQSGFDACFGPEYLNTNYYTQKTLDRYSVIKAEVEQDYQAYYRLTGGSEKQYAQFCAKLLWGNEQTFQINGVLPTTTSMTGALYEYAHGEGLGDATIDNLGNRITYKAIWLRDWYITYGGVTENDWNNRMKIFDDHFADFDPGRILIAVRYSEGANAGELEAVGSLSYVYIDPRFRNEFTGQIMENISSDRLDADGNRIAELTPWEDLEDLSCVLYWEPLREDNVGGFKVLNLFPQLYIDGDGIWWKINGKKTKIPANGTQGPAGRDGHKFVIVERVENVRGATQSDPFGTEISFPHDSDYASQGTVIYNYQSSGRSAAETLHYGMTDQEYTNLINKYDPAYQYTRISMQDGAPVRSVILTGQSWPVYKSGYVSQDLKNTYRVLRIVGGNRLWQGSQDIYRGFDPAFNDAAEMKSDASTQSLVDELDGSPCVVIPGPSFLPDRTDTTFWFGILKAVKIKEDSNTKQLIVYCGPENMMNKDMDAHTYAGMFMTLDTYSHKRVGDNRNQARGLMIPIGSNHIRYGQNLPPSALFGAHIISSDSNPFRGIGDRTSARRWGMQTKQGDLKTSPAGMNVFLDNNEILIGPASYDENNQFLEVYGKRILHIGSVNDYRTLDDVPGNNITDDEFNAAVPGRRPGQGNDNGALGYGTADFWGETATSGVFVGSELHVDEPLTVTRYRDIHPNKRWLGIVEGDMAIGTHYHVNDPNGEPYYKSEGGLFVGSTISKEIAKGLKNDDTHKHSVFNDEFWDSVNNTFRPKYHSPFTFTRVSTERVYRTCGSYNGEREELMFSGLFDDTIGARVVTTLDGFMVYDQFVPESENKIRFSVNANGDIQTLGNEVRSNSYRTIWYYHTRWDDPTATSYPLNNVNNPNQNGDFYPSPNNLQFGTDHIVAYDENWTNIDNVRLTQEEDEDGMFSPELKPFYWKLCWNLDGSNETVNKILNVSRLPMGFHVKQGFASNINQFKTSLQYRDRENNLNNAESYASDLPTVIKNYADTIEDTGGHIVSGLNILPVYISKSKKLLTSNNDPQKHTFARFGLQSRHAIYIGSESIREGYDGETKAWGDKIKLDYFPYEDNVNQDSRGMYGDKNMFSAQPKDNVTFSPALWVESDAYFGGSIVADENAWFGGAISAGRQVRAKSFRRHTNSETNNSVHHNSKWGFLLDNGYSSYNAAAHTSLSGNDCTTPEFGSLYQSPIVIDLGEWWGSKRLLRFGYAKSVNLNSDWSVNVVPGGEDNNITLFAKYPKKAVDVFRYGWDGNVIFEHIQHESKTKKYHQIGKIPKWFADLWEWGLTENNDNVTAQNPNIFYKSNDSYSGDSLWNTLGSLRGTELYRNSEISIVEVMQDEHMVTVNLYIVLKTGCKQEGGNRWVRGIVGAGAGSNNHGQKVWYNLHTHLRLPLGAVMPSHSVFANTPGMISSTNWHQDQGEWQDKGLNGDDPQQANIHWRLDPDGWIYMDNVCQGGMLVGENVQNPNGIYPVITARFIYPIEEQCRIMDETAAVNHTMGTNGGDNDGNDHNNGGSIKPGGAEPSGHEYLVKATFNVTKIDNENINNIRYEYKPSYEYIYLEEDDKAHSWCGAPSIPIIIKIADNTFNDGISSIPSEGSPLQTRILTSNISVEVEDPETLKNKWNTTVVFEVHFNNNTGDQEGQRADVPSAYPKIMFAAGKFTVPNPNPYDPNNTQIAGQTMNVNVPTKVSDLELDITLDDLGYVEPEMPEVPDVSGFITKADVGTLTITQGGEEKGKWNPCDGDKTIELDAGGSGDDTGGGNEKLKVIYSSTSTSTEPPANFDYNGSAEKTLDLTYLLNRIKALEAKVAELTTIHAESPQVINLNLEEGQDSAQVTISVRNTQGEDVTDSTADTKANEHAIKNGDQLLPRTWE